MTTVFPWWREDSNKLLVSRYPLRKLSSQTSSARVAGDRFVMNEKYRAYLDSDEWKARRSVILEGCNGSCEGCGYKGPLDVHHLTYARIFNEPLSDLIALCRECHSRVERMVENQWMPRTDEPIALRAFTRFALRDSKKKRIKDDFDRMTKEERDEVLRKAFEAMENSGISY